MRPSVLWPWLLTILIAACGGDAEPSSAAGDESLPPQTLVALAPNLVETVFELGLGDRLVGVGDFATWPPEVEDLPRLGGLLDPHLEEIARLAPDLALLLPSEAELGRKLERLGVASLVVPSETLADVEASLEIIARRCGVEEAGRAARDRWRKGLDQESLAANERVLLVVGRTPGRIRDVYVAGPGTFLSELVTRLGALNVFSDLDLPYPQVGLDSIIARDPTVILELHGETLNDEQEAELRREWEELLPNPPRIRVISGSHVLIPGPRIPQLVGELSNALAAAE